MLIESPGVTSARISQIDFEMRTFFPQKSVLSLELLQPLVGALRQGRPFHWVLRLTSESVVLLGGTHRRRHWLPAHRGRRQPRYTCSCILCCSFRHILVRRTARRGLWRQRHLLLLLIMVLTVARGLFLLRLVAVMSSAKQRLEFHHGHSIWDRYKP